MAQLHLLVVVDSEDGSFHLAGMNEAPVDSDMSVWEDDDEEEPIWRSPTAAEIDTLIDAEARLTALFEGNVGALGLPFTEVGGLAQAFAEVLVDRGYTKDQMVARLRDIDSFDEVLWWETAGRWVDEFATVHIDMPAFPEAS